MISTKGIVVRLVTADIYVSAISYSTVGAHRVRHSLGSSLAFRCALNPEEQEDP